MRYVLALVLSVLSNSVFADWYYYVYKIECNQDSLRIIDYSAHNSEGDIRSQEPSVIYAENLAVWGINERGDRFVVKYTPHVENCNLPFGNYRITIETGGGSPAWGRWTVEELSSKKQLYRNNMTEVFMRKRELVFKKEQPNGVLIEE